MAEPTAKDLLKGLEEVVSLLPDWRNPCNEYEKDGGPCCIIGYVLSGVGFTVEQLDEVEGKTAQDALEYLYGRPFRAHNMLADTARALYEVQALADRPGVTWYNALAGAAEICPETLNSVLARVRDQLASRAAA